MFRPPDRKPLATAYGRADSHEYSERRLGREPSKMDWLQWTCLILFALYLALK